MRREEMSPLFMDTGYEPNSPGSLSAEESHSNTAGSEREGEGQQTGKRGTKRQEKNRDAARKTRRKQTERADELHEELQGLEQSNSALHKEIASLKKDLQLYTTALERHKSFCCLKDSASSSSSTTCLSGSPSAGCQTHSSPPRVPPQASSSSRAAAPSLSTSLTSSLGPQTLNCVGGTRLSSSTPAPTTTTLASPAGSSSELFKSSGSVVVPYSVSFSTVAAPHSLFSDPPSLITSRQTNVVPVCTSLVSSAVTSSSLTAAGQPQSSQGAIHEHPSMSANACFSTLHLDALDAFLIGSTNVASPRSHLAAENAGLVEQSCPMNVPQLHRGHFRGSPINSSQLPSLLLPTLQDPAPRPVSVSPQAVLATSPASAFASKPSYSQHVAPNPASLLSLLTVPSPLSVSQTTSSNFDGPPSQPVSSLPPLGDPLRDLSLSELLDVNDWILQ
ncbi:uncharacterized serine-rich protein C215.13 [Morone saxatilis]|uniref:uncharacterized serine-rich protein C215.13 n=1 Tax=Morone saxatilis TaxID=34816 RepID=UPI0015E237D9|nr:uncharacterized serine-rich protein C215.13 [Morone saxatilis]